MCDAPTLSSAYSRKGDGVSFFHSLSHLHAHTVDVATSTQDLPRRRGVDLHALSKSCLDCFPGPAHQTSLFAMHVYIITIPIPGATDGPCALCVKVFLHETAHLHNDCVCTPHCVHHDEAICILALLSSWPKSILICTSMHSYAHPR